MVSTLMGTPTDEQMKVGHSWSSQDPRIHSSRISGSWNWPRKVSARAKK